MGGGWLRLGGLHLGLPRLLLLWLLLLEPCLQGRGQAGGGRDVGRLGLRGCQALLQCGGHACAQRRGHGGLLSGGAGREAGLEGGGKARGAGGARELLLLLEVCGGGLRGGGGVGGRCSRWLLCGGGLWGEACAEGG